MMGSENRHNTKAFKAAEAHGLLEFAVELLQFLAPEFQRIGGAKLDEYILLLAAGQAALELDQILASCQFDITEESKNDMFDSYLSFGILFERAGGDIKPKFHLLLHCFASSFEKGNPRYYTTYQDESLNGVIAGIAASSHRRNWQATIHRKINMLTALGLHAAMH